MNLASIAAPSLAPALLTLEVSLLRVARRLEPITGSFVGSPTALRAAKFSRSCPARKLRTALPVDHVTTLLELLRLQWFLSKDLAVKITRTAEQFRKSRDKEADDTANECVSYGL